MNFFPVGKEFSGGSFFLFVFFIQELFLSILVWDITEKIWAKLFRTWDNEGMLFKMIFNCKVNHFIQRRRIFFCNTEMELLGTFI